MTTTRQEIGNVIKEVSSNPYKGMENEDISKFISDCINKYINI